MKIIKYKLLTAETNHGTEERPDIEQVFLAKSIECKTEAQYNENIPIVLKEAYGGEYTVEGEFEEVVDEPTTDDVLNALLGVTV